MVAKTVRQLSGLAAWGSVALTGALSLFSALFTSRLATAASSVIGLVPGVIRAEFVASQVRIFWISSALFLAFVGLGVAAFYDRATAVEARSIAAGHGPRGAAKLWIALPLASCFLLGVFLPRALFQVTNPLELSRQQMLLGWATRSVLGGLVLGLFMAMVAIAFACGFYLLFIRWPRHSQAKKYERLLETT